MCGSATSSARVGLPMASTPPARSMSRHGPKRSRPTTPPGVKSRVWRQTAGDRAPHSALLHSGWDLFDPPNVRDARDDWGDGGHKDDHIGATRGIGWLAWST